MASSAKRIAGKAFHERVGEGLLSESIFAVFLYILYDNLFLCQNLCENHSKQYENHSKVQSENVRQIIIPKCLVQRCRCTELSSSNGKLLNATSDSTCPLAFSNSTMASDESGNVVATIDMQRSCFRDLPFEEKTNAP